MQLSAIDRSPSATYAQPVLQETAYQSHEKLAALPPDFSQQLDLVA